MKRETKFPWWGWLVVLCLLPVIYVLSVFLVIWIIDRLGLEFHDEFETFYRPLFWADEEWVWFRDAMRWIEEWMGIT
jgi:hypothetical protein